jgi:transcription antitermination factor NusG
MPILESEPDLYPASLFEGGPPAGKWWAVYTMSRREKELMRRLRQLEVTHYGPVIPCSYKSPNGRRRTSYLPLFSNYVFLSGSDEQRVQALTTNCVSKVLEVPDPASLFADLKALHDLIAVGAPLAPEARIESGDRVLVKTGAFAGKVGTVIRRQGRMRLLVMVNFLQQGASVDIDDCDVERIA